MCAGVQEDSSSKVLLEIHHMVSSLVKRVENTEKELKELKHIHMSAASSSSSINTKREIPSLVRVSLSNIGSFS